jgi:phosphoglycerate dehydrogenase-like enzyme
LFRVVLAMDPYLVPLLFDDAARERLAAAAEVDFGLVVTDAADPALAGAGILLTCWGAPRIDERVLALAPGLRAVVHAAGSIRWLITDAGWDAGLQISSAAWVNALPVAEYTVAAVLMAGKRLLAVRDEYRKHRGTRVDPSAFYAGAGNYHRTIGIVGASLVGRRVLHLLQAFDLDLLLYDPYVTPATAAELGAELAGLDELCARSDVVSVHAPELPSTRHLIGQAQLARMRDGATLINTARGSLVDQDALTREASSGRLNAVIDVTEPDVLPAASPLYDLPNVLLTPHIAGSAGTELLRLGAAATDEAVRFASGRPFAHPITRAELDHSA